ncbi:MAG TPA: GNAT family N-acetyltransferase [Candidatus Limnocylindrales bacterium]
MPPVADPLRPIRPTSLAYLEVVTRLLHDLRLSDPEGGLWEAADLQWWWRIDQHPAPAAQAVWLDGDRPDVAVVFTEWKDAVGCDLLGSDAAVTRRSDRLWQEVHRQATDREIAMIIRDDDAIRTAAAERAGFVRGPEQFVTGWMDADERRRPGPPPNGIRIESYRGGHHPMETRNGEAVARRLAECSLYRPDLDLAILDGDEVVGYALFWADPVTRVGLLEPMRIEASHQGRGLSKVLIAEGMDRLARAGCTRLKVTFDSGNAPAARLYAGAGYRPRSSANGWTRPAS